MGTWLYWAFGPESDFGDGENPYTVTATGYPETDTDEETSTDFDLSVVGEGETYFNPTAYGFCGWVWGGTDTAFHSVSRYR